LQWQPYLFASINKNLPCPLRSVAIWPPLSAQNAQQNVSEFRQHQRSNSHTTQLAHFTHLLSAFDKMWHKKSEHSAKDHL
jgi:hypothetical protein